MESVRAAREKIVLDHFHDEVQQDWDAVLVTFPHPRYELIPLGVVYDGHTEVRQYYIDTRVAFPDQRHEMIRLRHADDAVVCGLDFTSPRSYLTLAKALRGMRTLSSVEPRDEVHRIPD